jgi:hypothetical protein
LIDHFMRDIRPDLKERLLRIASRRITLQAELDELSLQESRWKALLEDENALWEQQAAFGSVIEGGDPDLATGIHRILSDDKAHDLDEFKEQLKDAPYMPKDKNHGRVIHFALVGMQNHGIVVRNPDDTWQAVPQKKTGAG